MWAVWQVCVFTGENSRCFYGNPSECYCMHWAHWHYITLKRAWTHMQPGFLWRYKKKEKKRSLFFIFLSLIPLCLSTALSHSIFRTHSQILLHLIWNAEIIHLHIECIPPFLWRTPLISLEMSLDLDETGHRLEEGPHMLKRSHRSQCILNQKAFSNINKRTSERDTCRQSHTWKGPFGAMNVFHYHDLH